MMLEQDWLNLNTLVTETLPIFFRATGFNIYANDMAHLGPIDLEYECGPAIGRLEGFIEQNEGKTVDGYDPTLSGEFYQIMREHVVFGDRNIWALLEGDEYKLCQKIIRLTVILPGFIDLDFDIGKLESQLGLDTQP